jgi:23S rRNA (cytosine1962-C5)-methyltransferase
VTDPSEAVPDTLSDHAILRALPMPGRTRIAMHLHPRAERAVRRGHPWVFAHAVRQQRREGRAGDLAVLFDRDDRFLAVGLYDPASPIRVRVLQRGTPAVIDRAWLGERLHTAHARREPLLSERTTGYRVVHGENDALPGLVVDRYGDALVVKLYTAAWVPYLRDLVEVLLEMLAPARIVLRLSRAARAAPEALHGLEEGMLLHGPPLEGPVHFEENGLTFEADLVKGQKTGFFLDQRDNRARVERLAAGRRVLNVFAYTGGFSLYAARGGARAVTSLDLSGPALAAAERNFAHNQGDAALVAARHDVLHGDAFELLAELGRGGERYDMVILDPPAFAKAEAEIDGALRSYERLVRLGVGVLAPGGVLVAASCSSRIDADTFAQTVTDAARAARRPLILLEQTGHALDHPIGFAEGAYLKCIFATAA